MFTISGKYRTYLILFGVAFAVVFIYFALWYNVAYSTADEGYLWNGVLLVHAGKVPLLDFQSYDPLRYYWCAFVGLFVSDDIIGVRLAMAIVQCIAVYTGLIIFSRASKNLLVHIVLAVIMVLWFFPYHKTFDIAFSIFSVYFVLKLLENREKHVYYLLCGFFTGFSAFVGRNAGLYNLIIFLLLFIVIWIWDGKTRGAKFVAYAFALWCLGIFIGYLPMIAMCAFIPGFFAAFLASVLEIVRSGTTNLTLPVPWPWLTLKDGVHNIAGFAAVLTGLWFVLMPALYGIGIIYGALKKNIYVLACSTVGVIYIQYAFSRADISHAGHSVLPLMLLVFGGMAGRRRYRGAVITHAAHAVCVCLVCLAVVFSAGVSGRVYTRFTSNLTAYRIPATGEMMLTSDADVSFYSALDVLRTRYGIQGKELLAAPIYPGVYPLLGLQSPSYYSYFLTFKHDRAMQLGIIADVKRCGVKYILLSDYMVDGNPDLAFNNAFDLVYAYIVHNYTPVVIAGLPNGYTFLIRNDLA